MSRILKITGFVFIMIFTAGMVFADWNSKDVDKIVQKIKAGEDVSELGSYPGEGVQQVQFRAGDILYRIDIKAKLCFGHSMGSSSVVPCKSIKDGYPLFAPIITWEK